MGRRANSTTVEVHEGVYLKLHSGVLHCYFRLAGQQYRRSTKTRDKMAAKLFALSWYREVQDRLRGGEQVESVSFAKLKRSYLDHLRGQSKASYHAATIERHFLPFFARFDDVARIKRSDLLEYVKFRRSQGENPPTPQTINRENTVLRQLLRYAVDKNWMRVAAKIDSEFERLTRRRRRHFNFAEYWKLCKTARRRACEIENAVQFKLVQQWKRHLLFDVIMLMANTGLRVDELKTLIWRNVDWADGSLLLEHAGKTRSTRRVLMRRGALFALQRIKQRRLDYLARTGAALNMNETVISLPNGKRVSR